MLPDLRIVIVAVFSTFIFAVSVGFFTSYRLMTEPKTARSDSLAAFEDSPINRIALNWPEPVQQTSSLDLDFAVNARASRNPVRDITDDAAAVEAPAAPPARDAAPDRLTRLERPQTSDARPAQLPPPPAPAPIESKPEPAPAESIVASAPATIEPAAPGPIATAPAVESKTAEAAAAPPPAEAPAATGSIPDAPRPAEPARNAPPPVQDPDTRIASLPDPLSPEADAATERPAPTLTVSKRAAPKKAAAKRVKRPARTAQRRAAASATTANQVQNQFPFSLFQHSFPN